MSRKRGRGWVFDLYPAKIRSSSGSSKRKGVVFGWRIPIAPPSMRKVPRKSYRRWRRN